MSYHYDHKFCSSEVLVTLCGAKALLDRRDLGKRLTETGRRFGFRVAFCSAPGDAESDSGARLNLLIWLTDRSWQPSDCFEFLALRHCGFDAISVAYEYHSLDALRLAGGNIEAEKAKLGEFVNYLRPDEFSDARWQVSTQKVLDNAVCDTVRIKYVPEQRFNDVSPELISETWPHFEAASRLYEEFQLFHRAPSDGYFAQRVSDCEFLITSTKTAKINLSRDRISLVHHYDETSNVISYSGSFLPSSDSVEAALTFTENPKVVAILHTHASSRFTRNPVFRDRIKVPRLPYGESDLGRVLASVVNEDRAGFIIMEEHGEVFFGPCDLSQLSNTVRAICIGEYEAELTASPTDANLKE